jgi:hypothetical protein
MKFPFSSSFYISYFYRGVLFVFFMFTICFFLNSHILFARFLKMARSRPVIRSITARAVTASGSDGDPL